MHQNFTKDMVIGSSVPNKSLQNVKKAGESVALRTMPDVHIPFDGRGYPILDAYAVVETRISWAQASVYDSALHLRAATRTLREEINAGRISKDLFTPGQLRDIMSGKERIRDFTWHHHQEKARLQLIPTIVHEGIDHVGGASIWFSKETKALAMAKKKKNGM